MVLFAPLHVGHPLWFAPVAALEDLGLLQRRPGVGGVSYLACRGSGSTRNSGKLATRAARNIVLSKSKANTISQYTPAFLLEESH